MSKFIITDRGRALQAKVLAGRCKYEFTKIGVGDGYVDTSNDYASMNDLQQRKVDIPVSTIAVLDNGICEISGVMTNSDLTEPMYVRESGLYAKDPDDGEILFCARYYERPTVVDIASSGPYTKEFVFKIGAESTDNVNITVTGTGLVTESNLMKIGRAHV